MSTFSRAYARVFRKIPNYYPYSPYAPHNRPWPRNPKGVWPPPAFTPGKYQPPPLYKPFTKETAYNKLDSQIEDWQSQSWHYPANVLRWFIGYDVENGGNGPETYKASKAESAEVKPHAIAMVSKVLAYKYPNGLPDDIDLKDVEVRWLPSTFVVQTLGQFSGGISEDDNDYMFAAYFGARMSIKGKPTDRKDSVLVCTGNVYSVKTHYAHVEVTINDTYTFPPGKWDSRITASRLLESRVYEAAYYLEYNYPDKYNKFDTVLSFDADVSYNTYKLLSAPFPFPP